MSQAVRSNSPDAPKGIPCKSFVDEEFVPTVSHRPMGRLPLQSALLSQDGDNTPPDDSSD